MAVEGQNWSCYPGETVTLTAVLTNVVAGQGLTFAARARPGGATVLTKSGTAAASAAGVVGTFTLSVADTGTALGVGTFDYTIERTDLGAEAVLTVGALSVRAK